MPDFLNLSLKLRPLLAPARQLITHREQVYRPRRASGVRLVGPVAESAFTTPPWLLERDGRFVQVDQKLYRVVELADGTRSLDQIARELSTTNPGTVCSADHVRRLVQERLIPSGLIEPDPRVTPSPPATAVQRPAPASPLALRMRMAVVPPKAIDALTAVLRYLYAPPLLVLLLLVIGQAQWWLFAVHGVSGALQDAVDHPAHVPAVFGLLIASAAFHEFGHAAALRYGGGRVRGMGVGFYLVYPALYTDVTDNYRLRRWPRVRTDLGGFYFNLLFSLGLMVAYHVTAQEFLLLAALLIDAEILHQCLPFARLDGYWALADLTGIPDFLTYMGPYLRSILPFGRGHGRRLPKLKWWATLVFGLYVAVAVPAIVLFIVLAIRSAPRVYGSAWAAVLRQLAEVSRAQASGDGLAAAGAEVQMLALLLPAFGLGLMLFTVFQRALVFLWRFSRPSWVRRAAAGLVALGLASAVAMLWSPGLPSLAAPDLRTHTVEPTSAASPMPTADVTSTPTTVPTQSPTAVTAQPAPTVATEPTDTALPTQPLATAAPTQPASTVAPSRPAPAQVVKPQAPRPSVAPTPASTPEPTTAPEPTAEPTTAPTVEPSPSSIRKPAASPIPIASPRPRTP